MPAATARALCVLAQGGTGPILKLAGKDATRQFLLFHDRGVLADRPELRIGVVDDSVADAPAPAASTSTSDWMFGQWVPPAGADPVRVPHTPFLGTVRGCVRNRAPVWPNARRFQ